MNLDLYYQGQCSNLLRVAYHLAIHRCMLGHLPKDTCLDHFYDHLNMHQWTFFRHPICRYLLHASYCLSTHRGKVYHHARQKDLFHWAYYFAIHQHICYHLASSILHGLLSMHFGRNLDTDFHRSTFLYRIHAICLDSSNLHILIH